MKFKRLKIDKSLWLSNDLRYALKFASIISPGTLSNISLIATRPHRNVTKLLVKQSYLMLTW